MADNVALSTIRSAVRLQGDRPHTNRPTNANLLALLNNSYKALYDLIVKLSPERFLSAANVTVSSGTGNYDLESDFYKLISVLLYDSSYTGDYLPLERVSFKDRYSISSIENKVKTKYEIRNNDLYLWPVPTWSGTVRVEYIPTPTVWTTDDSTVDLYNGWDEWIILDVIIKLKSLDEEDFQAELIQKQMVEARIMQVDTVDISRPKTMTDVANRTGFRKLPWGGYPW